MTGTQLEINRPGGQVLFFDFSLSCNIRLRVE